MENLTAIPKITSEITTESLNTYKEKEIYKEKESVKKKAETADIENDAEEISPPEFVSAVVDYLNNRSGSSYRAKTESTRRSILARRGEGYTLEDFKLVIDDRWAQWKGSDMEQFMRPDTLFRPSKFENYLSEAKKHTKAADRAAQTNEEPPREKKKTVPPWEIVQYPPDSGNFMPWYEVPEEDRAEYEPKLP